MKHDKLFVLSIILLCFLLLSTICTTSVTPEKNYQISLTNKTCTVFRIVKDPPPTMIYLNVSVILYNAGPDTSDDITVAIWDAADLTQVKRNATIPAGESKIFSFTGDTFFVVNEGLHAINISYYPTDKNNISETPLNSGIDRLTVQAGTSTNGTKTPGFELCILVVALMVSIYISRKRKK